MNPETKIEQKAVDLVWKLLGIKGSKLSTPGDSKYPDRIFWVPGGKPLLIEFKRPGVEPETGQIYKHFELRKLGYKVEVCDNEVDALEAVIKAVGSTRLSKKSREILARARRFCFVSRSGSG